MGDKKDVSNRFIEAYERLLKDGIVANKKEFASSVGVSASMITEISKGRSSVGTSAIQNIVLLYNISGEWLLTGKGPMLKSEEQPLPEAKKRHPTHPHGGHCRFPGHRQRRRALRRLSALLHPGVRSQGRRLPYSCLRRLHDTSLLQRRHHCLPENCRDPFLPVGRRLCPRHQPGCSRKVCRGVREKRRLHPLRLRKQALQALFPPKRRHPLTQHHRRPRPPGLAMMSPGSAGFCTLLLCSSPVVSIPSPPKHPSRPLLYPSRTPLAPPFRGVPLPIHPLKRP